MRKQTKPNAHQFVLRSQSAAISICCNSRSASISAGSISGSNKYGTIPSCWPLKRSKIELSSSELPQYEFSATLSSPLPLPLLAGWKQLTSLVSQSVDCDNLQTIFRHVTRFSPVFFHYMTKITSDRWSTWDESRKLCGRDIMLETDPETGREV